MKFSYVIELTIEGEGVVKFQLPYTVAPYADYSLAQNTPKELHKKDVLQSTKYLNF